MLNSVQHLLKLDFVRASPSVPITKESDSLGQITVTNGYTASGIAPYESNQLYSGPGAISIGGNFTAGLDKKPYNLKFLNSQGGDVDFPLCGFNPSRSYRVFANRADGTVGFRNAIMLNIVGQALVPYTPKLEWAELYIDGVYSGLTQISQRVRRNSSLPSSVIQKLDSSSSNQILPTLSGGYIIEIDQYDDEPGDASFQMPINGLSTKKYKLVYPKGGDITNEQLSFITDYASDAVQKAVNGDFSNLDIVSVANAAVSNRFANNLDFTQGSTYFHKRRGEILKMSGLWDFDVAFGLYGGGGPRTDDSRNYFMNNFLSFAQYRSAERDAYNLGRNAMHSCIPYIRDGYNFLKSTGAYDREAALWSAPSQGYDTEIQNLQDYISARLYWMDDKYNPRIRRPIEI